MKKETGLTEFLLIKHKSTVSFMFLILLPFFVQGQKISEAKKHKTENIIQINLYEAFEKVKTYPLSTIAESVDYIALETTKNCLLGDYLKNIFITSEDIFIFDYQYVFHFSKNGKFINKIGKVGRGPGEYNRPMDVSVDTITKNIYILDFDRLLKYDYNGEFIKVHKLGKKAMNVKEYKEGIFLTDDMNYQYAEPDNRFSIYFYSEDEEKQIAKVDCPKKDKIPFSICSPIMYRFNQNTFLKDYWDNTVYKVENPFNLVEHAFINTGKFKFREKDDQSLFTGEKNQGEELVISIENMSESDRFIFMLANKGLFFYDKTSGKTQCCEFNRLNQKAYNFKNDLTKGPTLITTSFPFKEVDNNTFVTFNHAYEFFEDGVDTTNPKIKKLLQNLQPEDNPILVLVKLKK
jgi:hypothetical protein